MSYGSYTYDHALEVGTGENKKNLDVEIGLVCINPGTPPSGMHGPPEFYDPGDGPDWEIESVDIYMDNCPCLSVTQTQLENMFPEGLFITETAVEQAQDNGIVE